jgi:tetratricopeptide (TPR) repeat protein
LGDHGRSDAEIRRARELSAGLPRAERLSIEAQYHDSAGELDEALAIRRTLFESSPENLEYGLELSYTQASSGALSAAVATAITLRKLPPPAGNDPRIDLMEAYATSDPERTLVVARVAVDKGQAMGATGLVAEGLSYESDAWMYLGEFEKAVAANYDARQIYAAAGRRQKVAWTLCQAGRIRGFLGDVSAARARYEDCLAVRREIGQSPKSPLEAIAHVTLIQGDLPEAARSTAELRALLDQTREPSPADRSILLALEAKRLLLEGDLARAIAAAEDALARGRAATPGAAPHVVGGALMLLGEAKLAAGDLVGARRDTREAMHSFDALDPFNQIDWWPARVALAPALLARIAVADGRPEEGEALARRSIDRLQKGKQVLDEGAAQVTLARALVAQGKLTDASAAVDRAAALASRTGIRADRIDAAILDARIRALRRPADVAAARHEIDAALADASRSGLVPEQIEAALARGEIELQLGDRATGRARLETVAADAEAKGFLTVARAARAAIAASASISDTTAH